MKKLLHFGLALLASVSIALPTLGTVAFANNLINKAQCVETENSKCIGVTQDPAVGQNCTNTNCNIFIRYLNPAINLGAILAGLAVVIGIIIGGIQYATSGGDPQKAATGKGHVKKAVIALIGFFFLYAFLRFLIPGNNLLVE